MATTKSLAGKRCIITGASRGIGEAIARRFAASGARCTLISRSLSKLAEIRASIESIPEDGNAHNIIAGDVSERGFWEGVRKAEPNVDVLVNAAGITHYSLLMATSPELVEEVISTNLMGTIWGCQVMVKNMVKAKKGCIINVSSLFGIKNGKGSTVYAASKAGIIGLTRSMAAELGPVGIRVNAILPGYVDSQMTQGMTPEARSHALKNIPIRRFGKPSEVADAAMFLARNEYASNCVLNLDGGLSAT